MGYIKTQVIGDKLEQITKLSNDLLLNSNFSAAGHDFGQPFDPAL